MPHTHLALRLPFLEHLSTSVLLIVQNPLQWYMPANALTITVFTLRPHLITAFLDGHSYLTRLRNLVLPTADPGSNCTQGCETSEQSTSHHGHLLCKFSISPLGG